MNLTVAVGKKLEFMCRAGKYFSAVNKAILYKAQIQPALEYCSHICGAAAPTSHALLDAIQESIIFSRYFDRFCPSDISFSNKASAC